MCSEGRRGSRAINRKTLSQTIDRAAALRPGSRRRQTATQEARMRPSQIAENRALTAIDE
jgi:hypothetical protein